MDEFGTAFRRIAEIRTRQRQDAAAAAFTGFEDRHRAAGARQRARRHQARGSRADNHDVTRLR